MEEELQEQNARRNRVGVLMREVVQLSQHYQNKLELYDRITTYCSELMEDLLLIDFEAIEISTYRRPIHEIRTAIEEGWSKIQVCYNNITRDAEWLQNNIDSIQPQLVELWWLMTEDVQRRLGFISDYFLNFFQLEVRFKELIETYSERFKDDPHRIFEKYRHFSDW